MEFEHRLALVNRLVDAWNLKDTSTFAALLAEDVYWSDPALPEPARGREAVRRFADMLWRAFPDLRYTMTEAPCLAPDGTRIAVPWKLTGTHQGRIDPPGFAPTGRPIEIDGIDLIEFRGDLVSRIVTRFDALDLLEQLRILPRRPPPGSLRERFLVLVQRFIAFFSRRRG